MIFGRHYLVVNDYDVEAIRLFLVEYADTCSAPTWSDVGAKLPRCFIGNLKTTCRTVEAMNGRNVPERETPRGSPLSPSKKHVLFVCSQNRHRSATAQQMFSGREDINVASAGLDRDAVTVCTTELVQWADIIFVMERLHRNQLWRRFKPYLAHARVICLEIADEYEYMQAELVTLLKLRVDRYLP